MFHKSIKKAAKKIPEIILISMMKARKVARCYPPRVVDRWFVAWWRILKDGIDVTGNTH